MEGYGLSTSDIAVRNMNAVLNRAQKEHRRDVNGRFLHRNLTVHALAAQTMSTSQIQTALAAESQNTQQQTDGALLDRYNPRQPSKPFSLLSNASTAAPSAPVPLLSLGSKRSSSFVTPSSAVETGGSSVRMPAGIAAAATATSAATLDSPASQFHSAMLAGLRCASWSAVIDAIRSSVLRLPPSQQTPSPSSYSSSASSQSAPSYSFDTAKALHHHDSLADDASSSSSSTLQASFTSRQSPSTRTTTSTTATTATSTSTPRAPTPFSTRDSRPSVAELTRAFAQSLLRLHKRAGSTATTTAATRTAAKKGQFDGDADDVGGAVDDDSDGDSDGDDGIKADGGSGNEGKNDADKKNANAFDTDSSNIAGSVQQGATAATEHADAGGDCPSASATVDPFLANNTKKNSTKACALSDSELMCAASWLGPLAPLLTVPTLRESCRALVNHRDATGRPPLQYCLTSDPRHVALAHLLLVLGASPRARTPRGNTLLHVACQRGLPRLAELLIWYGADTRARSAMGLLCEELTVNNAEALAVMAAWVASATASASANGSAADSCGGGSSGLMSPNSGLQSPGGVSSASSNSSSMFTSTSTTTTSMSTNMNGWLAQRRISASSPTITTTQQQQQQQHESPRGPSWGKLLTPSVPALVLTDVSHLASIAAFSHASSASESLSARQSPATLTVSSTHLPVSSSSFGSGGDGGGASGLRVPPASPRQRPSRDRATLSAFLSHVAEAREREIARCSGQLTTLSNTNSATHSLGGSSTSTDSVGNNMSNRRRSSSIRTSINGSGITAVTSTSVAASAAAAPAAAVAESVWSSNYVNVARSIVSHVTDSLPAAAAVVAGQVPLNASIGDAVQSLRDLVRAHYPTLTFGDCDQAVATTLSHGSSHTPAKGAHSPSPSFSSSFMQRACAVAVSVAATSAVTAPTVQPSNVVKHLSTRHATTPFTFHNINVNVNVDVGATHTRSPPPPRSALPPLSPARSRAVPVLPAARIQSLLEVCIGGYCSLPLHALTAALGLLASLASHPAMALYILQASTNISNSSSSSRRGSSSNVSPVPSSTSSSFSSPSFSPFANDLFTPVQPRALLQLAQTALQALALAALRTRAAATKTEGATAAAAATPCAAGAATGAATTVGQGPRCRSSVSTASASSSTLPAPCSADPTLSCTASLTAAVRAAGDVLALAAAVLHTAFVCAPASSAPFSGNTANNNGGSGSNKAEAASVSPPLDGGAGSLSELQLKRFENARSLLHSTDVLDAHFARVYRIADTNGDDSDNNGDNQNDGGSAADTYDANARTPSYSSSSWSGVRTNIPKSMTSPRVTPLSSSDVRPRHHQQRHTLSQHPTLSTPLSSASLSTPSSLVLLAATCATWINNNNNDNNNNNNNNKLRASSSSPSPASSLLLPVRRLQAECLTKTLFFLRTAAAVDAPLIFSLRFPLGLASLASSAATAHRVLAAERALATRTRRLAVMGRLVPGRLARRISVVREVVSTTGGMEQTQATSSPSTAGSISAPTSSSSSGEGQTRKEGDITSPSATLWYLDTTATARTAREVRAAAVAAHQRLQALLPEVVLRKLMRARASEARRGVVLAATGLQARRDVIVKPPRAPLAVYVNVDAGAARGLAERRGRMARLGVALDTLQVGVEKEAWRNPPRVKARVEDYGNGGAGTGVEEVDAEAAEDESGTAASLFSTATATSAAATTATRAHDERAAGLAQAEQMKEIASLQAELLDAEYAAWNVGPRPLPGDANDDDESDGSGDVSGKGDAGSVTVTASAVATSTPTVSPSSLLSSLENGASNIDETPPPPSPSSPSSTSCPARPAPSSSSSSLPSSSSSDEHTWWFTWMEEERAELALTYAAVVEEQNAVAAGVDFLLFLLLHAQQQHEAQLRDDAARALARRLTHGAVAARAIALKGKRLHMTAEEYLAAMPREMERILAADTAESVRDGCNTSSPSSSPSPSSTSPVWLAVTKAGGLDLALGIIDASVVHLQSDQAAAMVPSAPQALSHAGSVGPLDLFPFVRNVTHLSTSSSSAITSSSPLTSHIVPSQFHTGRVLVNSYLSLLLLSLQQGGATVLAFRPLWRAPLRLLGLLPAAPTPGIVSPVVAVTVPTPRPTAPSDLPMGPLTRATLALPPTVSHSTEASVNDVDVTETTADRNINNSDVSAPQRSTSQTSPMPAFNWSSVRSWRVGVMGLSLLSVCMSSHAWNARLLRAPEGSAGGGETLHVDNDEDGTTAAVATAAAVASAGLARRRRRRRHRPFGSRADADDLYDDVDDDDDIDDDDDDAEVAAERRTSEMVARVQALHDANAFFRPRNTPLLAGTAAAAVAVIVDEDSSNVSSSVTDTVISGASPGAVEEQNKVVDLRRIVCMLMLRWARASMVAEVVSVSHLALHPLVQAPYDQRYGDGAAVPPAHTYITPDPGNAGGRGGRDRKVTPKTSTEGPGALMQEADVFAALALPEAPALELGYAFRLRRAAMRKLTHCAIYHHNSSTTVATALAGAAMAGGGVEGLNMYATLRDYAAMEQALRAGLLLSALTVAGPHASDMGLARFGGNVLLQAGLFDLSLGLTRHPNEAVAAAALGVIAHVTTPRKTRFTVTTSASTTTQLSATIPLLFFTGESILRYAAPKTTRGRRRRAAGGGRGGGGGGGGDTVDRRQLALDAAAEVAIAAAAESVELPGLSATVYGPPPTASAVNVTVRNRAAGSSSTGRRRADDVDDDVDGDGDGDGEGKPYRRRRGDGYNDYDDDASTLPDDIVTLFQAGAATTASTSSVVDVFLDTDLEAELAEELSLASEAAAVELATSATGTSGTEAGGLSEGKPVGSSGGESSSSSSSDTGPSPSSLSPPSSSSSQAGGAVSVPPHARKEAVSMQSLMKGSVLPASYLTRVLRHLDQDRRQPSLARHWLDMRLYGREQCVIGQQLHSSTEAGASMASTGTGDAGECAGIAKDNGAVDGADSDVKLLMRAAEAAGCAVPWAWGTGFKWGTLDALVRDCVSYLEIKQQQMRPAMEHANASSISFAESAMHAMEQRNYVEALKTSGLSQYMAEPHHAHPDESLSMSPHDPRVALAIRILFHLCHAPRGHEAVTRHSVWKSNLVDRVLGKFARHREAAKRARLDLRLDIALANRHMSKETDPGTAALWAEAEAEDAAMAGGTGAPHLRSNAQGVTVSSFRLVSFDLPDDNDPAASDAQAYNVSFGHVHDEEGARRRRRSLALQASTSSSTPSTTNTAHSIGGGDSASSLSAAAAAVPSTSTAPSLRPLSSSTTSSSSSSRLILRRPQTASAAGLSKQFAKGGDHRVTGHPNPSSPIGAHSNSHKPSQPSSSDDRSVTVSWYDSALQSVTETKSNSVTLVTTHVKAPVYSIAPPPIPGVDETPFADLHVSALPQRNLLQQHRIAHSTQQKQQRQQQQKPDDKPVSSPLRRPLTHRNPGGRAHEDAVERGGEVGRVTLKKDELMGGWIRK